MYLHFQLLVSDCQEEIAILSRITKADMLKCFDADIKRTRQIFET